MLNPKEPRPMISNGSPVTFTEPNGTTTTYYLFSNTRTSVLDAFTSRTWIYGGLCWMALTTGLIGITLLFLNRSQKPLEQMMQVAQQCAKGNYTEHLNPGSFEEPSYEDMAYSINELAYAAENAENQRKQFVSNVSHELRTPMTIISGYVDGMLDGTVPKNKRMQYLSIVSQEMQRLKILISSMLNLTKFDNGTIEIHYQLFPIQDLAFRTILMFESRLEKRNITLEGLDSEPVQVWGDPDLIGQVIYNLFENATKFVNTGERLRSPLKMNQTTPALPSGIPVRAFPKKNYRKFLNAFISRMTPEATTKRGWASDWTSPNTLCVCTRHKFL